MKICSMSAPNVREGESVDIEIDSGAEVSCLPANIGAETHPLHGTRLSMCGGHHVAVGGGKLHELGATILGLEAEHVRGAVVNLLVRCRVMNVGKALLSTQDLSCCCWETVFPADCGNAYLVRESLEHSHHAREETLCMVLESQAQASQRAAVQQRCRVPGGDDDGPESRCAACGRRWRLEQQWPSSS